MPTIVENYSAYKYYSGSFVQDGKIYGNSFYPESFVFTGADLSRVSIYTYDEYVALQKQKSKVGTGSYFFAYADIPSPILSASLKDNSVDDSGNMIVNTDTNMVSFSG